MSRTYSAGQFADPKGIVVEIYNNQGLVGYFAGVPTASILGYVPGALAIDVTNGNQYRNSGSLASATWTQLNSGTDLSTLTATATELNTLHGQTLTTEAAAGFTGGTGTVYKTSVQKSGGVFYTSLLFDVTGLGSSTTDGDIIGQGVSAAHMGQITAAQNGTILYGRMTCLEAPLTGVTDIDLFYGTVATGKFDDAISGVTGQTSLISAGGAWTIGTTKHFQDAPPANAYVYLVNGTSGTVGTYTAGKFLIEIFGY